MLLGNSGRQRYDRSGDPYLAVGLYVAANDAAYFEVFPNANLQRTMSVIGTSLAVGATVTTLAAAGLGWWASRRLLNPLSRVADAASELAEGGLDTRLPEESDPDLHRLVSSFNNMADAVQDRIEREARFASDVSHELRSPLTALTAAVEVLDARRDDLPARSQQALDVVTSQVRRFDQMVLDLLEISRLDAGVTEFNPEPVLLGDIVRRIAARYGFDNVPVWVDHRWAERPVAGRQAPARAHPRQPPRQRRAARRRPHPHRHRRRRRRHRATSSSRTPAPACRQSERTRIFERFARGTAARHRVGTGLGLALVAEHAAVHGGPAWVEDRPGGGARFVVSFPAGPSAARDPGGRWRRRAGGRRGRHRSLLAACGLPNDDTYTAIQPDDLPFGIADTTTTSTTTTTMPPATTTPPRPPGDDHHDPDPAGVRSTSSLNGRLQPVARPFPAAGHRPGGG